ncbi:hypothetical protein CF326_g2951 [Tilletia indica]|nr:hypothetical protein CF326_g2951 [Tilletia indica]
MCTGKAESLYCPTCQATITHRFEIEPCSTIKHGGSTCCAALSPTPVKVKSVENWYDCYECRLDAPRRAEEAKKKKDAAKKAAKAAEEAIIPRIGKGGDEDLELHSAQYW